jgi:hypothetical protein
MRIRIQQLKLMRIHADPEPCRTYKQNDLTQVGLRRAGDPGEEGGAGCEDEAHLRGLHPLLPQLQQSHQVTSLPALCNTSNMCENVKLFLISYCPKFFCA